MLKVTVDMERGTYIVSEGEDKLITKSMEHQYDAKKVKKQRNAIEKARKWIPTDKKKLIDVGVYETIQEFDRQFGTEYAEKYIDATIMQIPFTSTAESARDRQRRSRETRAEEFRKAGIEVEYNVSLFKGWKNLGFVERIQAIRQGFAQKQNGVKVNMVTGKQQLLVAPEVKEVERIEDLPGMAKEEPVQEPPMPPVQPIQQPEPEIVVPPVPEPEPIQPVQTELAQAPIQPEPKKIVLELDEEDIPPMPDEETLKKMQEADDKVRREKEEKEAEERRRQEEAQRKAAKRAEPKPKKAIKRCKAKQMAKNEQRAAAQMGNRYTGMIQAKAEKKARREASVGQPKQEKEIKDTPVQPTVTKKKKPVARTVVLAKNGSKAQKDGFVTRFTRKLKDKADSIRGKIHMPQLAGNQKKIAGAVTALALTGALAIGGYAILSNSNAQDLGSVKTPTPSRPTATETVKPEQLGSIEKGNFVIEESPAPTGTPVVSETPEVQKPAEGVEQETPTIDQEQAEKEAKIAYLSSIRVGTSMNISSGKYFASPEGQGNFGHFENYVDGVKEINMIDVMTDTQYITIKDPNVSLYELKQQYPNAKFSYHIVCRNADGTTTVLGWLTEESFEQNKDQEEQAVEQGDQEIFGIELDDEER